MKKSLFCLLAVLLCSANMWGQHKWTLDECLNYALENNISLKQTKIQAESSSEDEAQSKANLFPTVSASTSHSLSYRPFSEVTTQLSNGTLTSSQSETSFNGTYGINASWTVWNGGKLQKNVKKAGMTREIAELSVQETANTIQEQITQLYIQILYEAEALSVDSAVLEAAKLQRDVAAARVEIGDMAKVDLSQLEAQVAQDQLSLVQAQTQLASYKLQLKQLLEIDGDAEFDVALPTVDDARVLQLLPTTREVYEAALEVRPEIKSSQIDIQSADLDISIARAGYMPTISLSAGVNSSWMNGSGSAWAEQIKKNLSISPSISLSIPIWDGRDTKTSIRKAKLAKETSTLQLQSEQKELWSTIENYHLNAETAQARYNASVVSVDANQESYDLLSEQFRLGLKNIVELTTGKNDLLEAKQSLLESKYTALYNMAMLRFYKGEVIEL